MKSTLWFSAMLFTCASGAVRAATLTALDMCELRPVFMEEFDDLSIAAQMLGPKRWIAHTPWNGDFGDAVFADPTPNGPFETANGMLRITARRDPSGHWRSGLIAAGDASGAGAGVQYGYFEARMLLPPGPGLWPAFWLSSLKPHVDRGPGVEIDVMEYYGHLTGKFSSALHVWYPNKLESRHQVHWNRVPLEALVSGFHAYGLRVTPDVTTFYLDRQPIWQVATPPELKTPLFPLVDLALGSGFPINQTPDPSTLLVDYVHVYALDPAGRAADCPPAQ